MHRLLHLLLGVEEGLVDHAQSFQRADAVSRCS
jgi:hypothetical protein